MILARRAISGFLLVLISHLLNATDVEAQDSGRVPGGAQVWHRSLDRAVTLARQSGRPLFVVFRCER